MRFDHVDVLGDDVLLIARPLITSELPTTKEDD
jgi:diaminohydroxyphosphoribosylaminopyrimidine deaminase/5-amino-6-(5-phosphoribosylamino)uracil reductase